MELRYLLYRTGHSAHMHIKNRFKKLAPSCIMIDFTTLEMLFIAKNLSFTELQYLACTYLHLDKYLLAIINAEPLMCNHVPQHLALCTNQYALQSVRKTAPLSLDWQIAY